MAPSKEMSVRSGRKRVLLTQFEGEKDEDYRIRREKNNAAVRKSRDKSKKSKDETVKNIKRLEQENSRLEGAIEMLRNGINEKKSDFLRILDSGKVCPDQYENIDEMLKNNAIDSELSD